MRLKTKSYCVSIRMMRHEGKEMTRFLKGPGFCGHDRFIFYLD